MGQDGLFCLICWKIIVYYCFSRIWELFFVGGLVKSLAGRRISVRSSALFCIQYLTALGLAAVHITDTLLAACIWTGSIALFWSLIQAWLYSALQQGRHAWLTQEGVSKHLPLNYSVNYSGPVLSKINYSKVLLEILRIIRQPWICVTGALVN